MEQFKDVNRRKSKPKEKLNIAMFGQKRIPSREGGVEIVVEELCTRMVAQGHWLIDNEPCLLNVMLSSGTLLIPKIKWETCKIMPELEENKAREVQKLIAE